MNMFTHRLELHHDREPHALTLEEVPSESSVTVEATSQDLTEAWRELLSRLPNDIYAGLIAATVIECRQRHMKDRA